MSDSLLQHCIIPDWPVHGRVRAFSTTRAGGVSAGDYWSLNLGEHVGDDPANVAENRRRLRALLPTEPLWLRQVHGAAALDAAAWHAGVEADAIVARERGVVLAIQTADCMPVLLADLDGTGIGAAHAGWRGLAVGVVENTLAAMNLPARRIAAWLGPAIGPQSFEVGDEVRAAFVACDAGAAECFVPHGDGKWLADLYRLARLRLAALGVTRIHGGGFCTVREAERFFSHRRDKPSGRMATLIWLD